MNVIAQEAKQAYMTMHNIHIL